MSGRCRSQICFSILLGRNSMLARQRLQASHETVGWARDARLSLLEVADSGLLETDSIPNLRLR
jgi:hypothetical protein